MDIRKQKTQQAIREAFLQLRNEKNLEQISVTELAKAARISKATFYLHYRDIYDLSEQLQQEVIQRVITHIESPISVLENLSYFMQQMTNAINQEEPLLTILFSGAQMSVFPTHLEAALREYIFTHNTELKSNEALSVRLSYHIQGGYYADMTHVQNVGNDHVLDIIADIQKYVPSITED